VTKWFAKLLSDLGQTYAAAPHPAGNGPTNQSKDVLPNINRTQVAEIDLDLQAHPSEAPNTSSV